MLKTLWLIVFSFGALFAGEWQVDKKAENSVVFHSSTTLLDFKGTTDNIDGYIFWEGDSLFSGKNEFYFEVDLRTFNTGNGKRDRDMREDVLHTKRTPFSSFGGQILSHIKKGNTYILSVKGTLSLHGKNKEMEMPVTISFKEGKMVAEAKFSIFLKDYNIEAPSLMAFVKVAEEIKLNIKFKLKK